MAGITAGFGDRNKLGVDIGLNVLSLTGRHDGFGHRGSFNLKLHRALPEDLSLAAGFQNTLIWGSGSDSPSKAYFVASKRLRLKNDDHAPFSQVAFTGGLNYQWVGGGQGDFRPSAQRVIDESGRVNLIGSVAVRVAQPVNVFTEWTGDSLNLGASIVVSRRYSIVLTPVLADVAGYRPNGTRFNLGFGLPFSWAGF